MIGTLIGFEPRDLFSRWHTDIDRWFDGRTNGYAGQEQWTPAVDVQDVGEAYLLRADVPGMEAKDIELELNDGILSLKGTRKRTVSEDADRYSRYERASGSFIRRFRLPQAVGGEVTAKLTNGVLEVRISKPDKLQPRRIEVTG
jgi:HSP20 family protein